MALPLGRAPQIVVGYYGCEASVAEQLMSGKPFRLSNNDYDWLGSGAYFWEYAPFRAQEWAEEHFGADARIIRADIILGDCLNLLDRAFFTGLQMAHTRLADAFASAGVMLPDNRRGGNRLDRLVIDEFAQTYEEEGEFFDTVRGCFPEGVPLFDGSRLLSHTHVQIAVRNPRCIGKLEVVHFT
ncbi:MAG: hypothetical protein JWQ02_2945 [Capsulimonas sp.]|nr:hypothetical protein [Capsulimonas sp.]